MNKLKTYIEKKMNFFLYLITNVQISPPPHPKNVKFMNDCNTFLDNFPNKP